MHWIKELLIWVTIVFVIVGLASIGSAHEYGHADGIHHLVKGERTGYIERVDECPGQNKILLYIDEDRNAIVEVCATIWMEHSMLHYILSDPDENGNCECQGYLWLENDSQGGGLAW